MKPLLNILLLASLSVVSSNAFDLNSFLKKGTTLLESSNNPDSTASLSALSSHEVSQGLKEALRKGIEASIAQLGTTDGFYGDQLVKILMPQSMQNAADLVKKAGGARYVDDFVLAMNRAAEESVSTIAPLFANALSSMSVEDAKGILTSGDNAATTYFKNKTNADIVIAVAPIIQTNMEKNSVYTYYTNVKEYYDNLSQSALATSVKNSNLMAIASSVSGVTLGNGALLSKEELDAYMSTKTAEGLFAIIAKEEEKIRNSISARSTPLLKKVFGAL
ncbi:DUF4197 domain-containing protein [Sulfurospirillum sp. T05]|uniref:DUF4197 domain-containing protein n=1 Tax=Sulfurospirillum tamanense TaxID=2813362 RepID=A0ABS2WS95_9BACT|nr:DUF4197 domain-containing protein [Sulfurospirillum tamanensis]MBN2964380.1 DUF4197 domain-containing protein [Sulfurospirillum tamanensis]